MSSTADWEFDVNFPSRLRGIRLHYATQEEVHSVLTFLEKAPYIELLVTYEHDSSDDAIKRCLWVAFPKDKGDEELKLAKKMYAWFGDPVH